MKCSLTLLSVWGIFILIHAEQNDSKSNRNAKDEVLLPAAGQPDNGFILFKFPEYRYKDTPKNEKFYYEYEAACNQTPYCLQRTGIDRISCVRECISPSCYMELYHHDPLEEGEIDVRLTSFKGCFIRRGIRHRS